MACEVIIKLKNPDKSLVKKILVYENIVADFSDNKIQNLIAEVKSEFNEFAEKTTIMIKLIDD